jgi:hypothetical protein
MEWVSGRIVPIENNRCNASLVREQEQIRGLLNTCCAGGLSALAVSVYPSLQIDVARLRVLAADGPWARDKIRVGPDVEKIENGNSGRDYAYSSREPSQDSG